ncbi:MAG: hypothetical protein M1818_007253 [Claussenomyces sp. TS43310]|nr:MAG: hypothetical protein M1818_007253 [Claussenomyces sp. TS43310]
MAPPTTSDLIFSEQANHNFSKTLGDLKRHTLSVHNRLRSIVEDGAFVQKVSEAYDRPLIANERCGSWYIDPQLKEGSAYFKSTDGHTEMPDALSKTIPIWCCVLNRSLFPDDRLCHDLNAPPQIVSSSEHAQILARMDGFVRSFQALQLDLSALRKHVTKPIRPLWITPESHIFNGDEGFDAFHPVICCTASRRVQGGELNSGGYIQGAGDDTEHWALGLTPPVFWENKQLLLKTPEPEIPELIHKLCLSTSLDVAQNRTLIPVKPTSCLLVIDSALLVDEALLDSNIVVSLTHKITEAETWTTSPTSVTAGIGPHKLGSRNLRAALPHIVNFVTKCLRKREDESLASIVVACPGGKDHSVGVALALLCLLFDDDGHLVKLDDVRVTRDIDKMFIKRRLGWIMTSIPDANPTRATLQSINSYLMERPG